MKPGSVGKCSKTKKENASEDTYNIYMHTHGKTVSKTKIPVVLEGRSPNYG